MFDGIKLGINDAVTTAYLLKALDFITPHKESGEVINLNDPAINGRYKYKYAQSKGFHFKLFESGRLEIAGSLHYYFNNDKHNYNQFTMTDVDETIRQFAEEFKINPCTAIIHNLEFGVNLHTPYNPNYFIKRLVVHKTNQFNKMIAPFYGKISKYAFAQYWIKCYNKGQQFHQLNILRYELRVVKMEKINKRVYLADLLKPIIIDRCKKLLIDSFNDLIIKEPVSDLNTKDHKFYLEYVNPSNHEAFIDKHKRHRAKDKFNQLLERYSVDRIKENTLKNLIATLDNLITEIPKKCNLLTDYVKPKMQPFDHLDKLSNRNIAVIGGKPFQCCLGCGRPIFNQRPGSKYCSEKLYGKKAKKCRNKKTNPNNNFKRKIRSLKFKPLLFDTGPYFKIPPQLGIDPLIYLSVISIEQQ